MDDDALATLLRQHADRLTDGRTDTDAAYDAVARRARTARNRRRAVTAGLATAAGVIGVLLISGATDDQSTVRTPATAPAVSTTVVTPATTTLPATSTIATLPAVPATVPDAAPPTEAPATAAPPPPTTPAVSTATYQGVGGSITVRLEGGTVTLATDPSPAAGYTARVDDNGPDRVRVRFEGDGARTEIRVEVEGGGLVPTIDEN